VLGDGTKRRDYDNGGGFADASYSPYDSGYQQEFPLHRAHDLFNSMFQDFFSDRGFTNQRPNQRNQHFDPFGSNFFGRMGGRDPFDDPFFASMGGFGGSGGGFSSASSFSSSSFSSSVGGGATQSRSVSTTTTIGSDGRRVTRTETTVINRDGTRVTTVDESVDEGGGRSLGYDMPIQRGQLPSSTSSFSSSSSSSRRHK